MCQNHQHSDNKNYAHKKKYRLADFFNMYWDEYCKKPKEFILPEVYKAVNAIRVCRTEVLGVDSYACPDCGEISEVWHSCKNRFCPTCSWKDTIKWSEDLKSKMLNIPHRHIVVTVPHQLNPLIKNNKIEMLNILAKNAANTFKDWAKEKYNIKITNIEGEYLTFNYKDYKDRIDPKDKKSPAKVKELTYHYRDFFPLLLQHVPPPYFKLVRYYGAYHRFGQIPEEYQSNADEQLLETIETAYQTSEDNPKYCSACTSAKIYIHTLFDRRKKKDRSEPFNIEKHSHIFYIKYSTVVEEKNLKKAA